MENEDTFLHTNQKLTETEDKAPDQTCMFQTWQKLLELERKAKTIKENITKSLTEDKRDSVILAEQRETERNEPTGVTANKSQSEDNK